jgi:hypothetical protein
LYGQNLQELQIKFHSLPGEGILIFYFQAQARECLFEKLELQSRERRDVDLCLDLAQEAAQASFAKYILTS